MGGGIGVLYGGVLGMRGGIWRSTMPVSLRILGGGCWWVKVGILLLLGLDRVLKRADWLKGV